MAAALTRERAYVCASSPAHEPRRDEQRSDELCSEPTPRLLPLFGLVGPGALRIGWAQRDAVVRRCPTVEVDLAITVVVEPVLARRALHRADQGRAARIRRVVDEAVAIVVDAVVTGRGRQRLGRETGDAKADEIAGCDRQGPVVVLGPAVHSAAVPAASPHVAKVREEGDLFGPLLHVA